MAWVELQVIGLPARLAESLSVQLFEMGAAGTQEDYLPGEMPPPPQPWDTGPIAPGPESILLKAWFEDPDPQRICRDLHGYLGDLNVKLQWDNVPETDWEEHWKEGFEPIEIGPGLVISPPWNSREGDIIIDPGQAFGTGKHPSTLACLRAAYKLSAECSSLLDIGCGSGIITLVAAKFGLDAEGIDIDQESVRESLRNAKLNNLSAKFSVTPISKLTVGREILICNLYAEAITEMASDLLRLTENWLVLAGVLADREHLIREKFDESLQLVHREIDGEWVCLWYKR